MAIAHKDAGLFDSEAQNNVQPPGFAYIASPDQGSNQYGYWSHSGGQSVWTFLPEYLIMRELLWGHSYRPIYVNEYNGYQTALRSGRTYYGQETPASPPKYGSHGTFTAQRYASSRYVQSGGYSGSAYASNRSGGPVVASRVGLFSPRRRRQRRQEIRRIERWPEVRRLSVRAAAVSDSVHRASPAHARAQLRPPPLTEWYTRLQSRFVP